MPTQCNTKPLKFEPHGRRRVVADFDGGPITSDAGTLVLRRVDQRLSLSDQVAACFTDHRDPKRIQHSLRKLISQRILGIAQGYEDLPLPVARRPRGSPSPQAWGWSVYQYFQLKYLLD